MDLRLQQRDITDRDRGQAPPPTGTRLALTRVFERTIYSLYAFSLPANNQIWLAGQQAGVAHPIIF